MTTSATGGYLTQTEEALPGGLTLLQFIQQALVGISGLGATLVRPKWQKNPPKMLPQPEDNWMAFGIQTHTPDANAFVETAENGESSTLQRNELLTISCSFYGPDCEKNAGILRDGFQLTQNRDVLRTGNIGFKESGETVQFNELHGEVWFKRCDINIMLIRLINRTYEVLSIEAIQGEVQGQKSNDEIESVLFSVDEE